MIGIVLPTRARSVATFNLIGKIQETAGVELDHLRIALGVDKGDPEMRFYRGYAELTPGRVAVVVNHGRPGHGPAINIAAAYARHVWRADTLIKLDDDHMPRTAGWARELAETAGAWGIAYPDDGHQGEALPTVCAWGSALYDSLHRMVPGALRHLYVDDYWRELGKALGVLEYRGDLLVEHMHPHAGKAPDSDRYRAIYTKQRMIKAERAWELFRDSPMGLPYDVHQVTQAMEAER